MFDLLPVLSPHAVEVLADLLEGRGEILPLRAEGDGDVYGFDVTRMSDALDEDRSEIKRFDSVSVAMRKSPRVATSMSPLVAR